ncbi:hypothetical protein [Gordonia rubripertincta]|uniref:hypothetical protein n=1 Tax=Gordonia rubripertincta TaxID=36822 RepID=UPI0015FC1DEF|nr:hypothetical protein [Gordonia rubripertincta]QMU19328.1 hypothetical protein H3V45_14640 [Gordonia rubripertincta]
MDSNAPRNKTEHPPTLAAVIAKHRYRPQDHSTVDGNAYCVCGWSTPIINTHKTAVTLHAEHVASVIREQWLTAEYIAAGTEGPDMDWTSEDTWATPTDAEEWQRRTQNLGWVERRYVSEWVRLADEAEVQQ